MRLSDKPTPALDALTKLAELRNAVKLADKVLDDISRGDSPHSLVGGLHYTEQHLRKALETVQALIKKVE